MTQNPRKNKEATPFETASTWVEMPAFPPYFPIFAP